MFFNINCDLHLHQHQPELLRVGDPELLGQDVHGVLLTVRGHDILIVACLVVLRVVESEKSDDLKLPDSVDTSLLGDVQDLDPGLYEVKIFLS